MAKPKRSSSSGPRKSHGPKRKLFHDLKPLIYAFGQAGVLSKYCCEESFMLACAARGHNKVTHTEWVKFSELKTREDKDAYFASLKK